MFASASNCEHGSEASDNFDADTVSIPTAATTDSESGNKNWCAYTVEWNMANWTEDGLGIACRLRHDTEPAPPATGLQLDLRLER